MKEPGFLQRLSSKSNLLVLIILALLLGQIPYLSNFLSWQMTFFHEISHGLAALITGGRVLKIELHLSGSGLCYTSGGLSWLISFAGYAGAAFWGMLIYLAAGLFSKKYNHIPAVLLIAVLVASALLYARDIQSWSIIALIIVFYSLAIRFRGKPALGLGLKLCGLYILMDALKAPAALFRRREVSDAVNLAAQTGLPQFFWIILWLATSAGCLFFIWRLQKNQPCTPEDISL
ncbi:membrane zinc metalloprotease [Deltaproteobacteria bacterium Smac51]|nr:membrane zinc metalloprotease [Deltaproteobacteria bacterium Smac51]